MSTSQLKVFNSLGNGVGTGRLLERPNSSREVVKVLSRSTKGIYLIEFSDGFKTVASDSELSDVIDTDQGQIVVEGTVTEPTSDVLVVELNDNSTLEIDPSDGSIRHFDVHGNYENKWGPDDEDYLNYRSFFSIPLTQEIDLPEFNIKIKVDPLTKQGKIIESNKIRPACPNCQNADCFLDCDQSQASDLDDGDSDRPFASLESEKEIIQRAKLTTAIDVFEAFILAAACAGINVRSPEFLETMKSVSDTIENEYGE